MSTTNKRPGRTSFTIDGRTLADYLTEDELASRLGKSRRTIERWREQRTGPPPTFVGKTVRYFWPSVLGWLRSRERPMPRAHHRA
jgi:hypothetical protein